MSTFTMEANTRKDSGKNATGRLRQKEQIPAIMTKGGQSQSVELDEKAFNKLLVSGLRQSSIINLNIDGNTNRVIVREIQRHPVTDRILHVDFLGVTDGKKTQVKVAIETSGVSKGVKAGGALEHFIRGLKIRANPETFKDVITVDITNLDVGDAVHLKDLDLPAAWELVKLEGNPIVLKIARSRMAAQSAGGAEAGTEEAAAAG
ncbi:MAG: 50S ribosomal protein L25 [Leptospiraceae bacterium]|nr:50S ribosomal protein L25 [Leptospiraceae bacterium]